MKGANNQLLSFKKIKMENKTEFKPFDVTVAKT